MAHSMVLMVTGVVVDVERAGGLARRRAHAARHLGEVVGGVQVERRRLPLVAVDEVVPVRDLVVDRAAVVAVGDAAVHAARRLRLRPRLAAAARRTRANASRARPPAGSCRSWRSNSMKPVILPIARSTAVSANCRTLTSQRPGYTSCHVYRGDRHAGRQVGNSLAVRLPAKLVRRARPARRATRSQIVTASRERPSRSSGSRIAGASKARGFASIAGHVPAGYQFKRSRPMTQD